MFKKIKCALCILLIAPSIKLNAQGWTLLGNTVFTDTGVNKVGINTTAPLDMLTIKNGDLGFVNSTNRWPCINGHTDSGGLKIATNYDQGILESYGPLIELGGPLSFRPGQILYFGYTNNQTAAVTHSFINYHASPNDVYTDLMDIIDDHGQGKVRIGNVSIPGNYSLYVEHGILTEKVKVALSNISDWSDYVFSKNYQLKPIADVEDYIKDNMHLPGVPSAQEVVNNGLNVAEMDATLLKKIEELTLYVIQQQKAINKQQEELIKLQEQLKASN